MILSRRNLPLNAMRAFEAAARHCHLRNAAEELGVTHGAVSRQIKQLEGLLGVALFDRSHNRLSLTAAGQRLLTGVQEGLDKIAESTLHLDPASMSGSLVIASTPSISAGWLVGVLGAFSRKYPEVELHLINIDPLQVELPTDIDLAICYGRPNAPQRETVELFRERYFPVCHPTLLRSDQAVVKAEDVLAYPLLHDRHGHWQRWFDCARVEGSATQNLHFQDSLQVLTAVREGFGVGLVDHIEVQRDLHRGQLVALSDETVEAAQSHYLVTDKLGRITERARLFSEYLQHHLALQDE